MAINGLFGSHIKKTSKVGCAYRNQVVEAIRVSHDLVAGHVLGEGEFIKHASLASDSHYH